jgi:CheY-like chemotaxis protein
MRVPVIEDDASIARLLADLLADEGHAVTRVADAAAGLTLARARPWDACLTDGYWAATTAAARAYLTDLAACCPVVLLSGRVWARSARPADLGVAAPVPKPFEPDDVLDALGTVTSSPVGRRRRGPDALSPSPRVDAVRSRREGDDVGPRSRGARGHRSSWRRGRPHGHARLQSPFGLHPISTARRRTDQLRRPDRPNRVHGDRPAGGFSMSHSSLPTRSPAPRLGRRDRLDSSRSRTTARRKPTVGHLLPDLAGDRERARLYMPCTAHDE